MNVRYYARILALWVLLLLIIDGFHHAPRFMWLPETKPIHILLQTHSLCNSVSGNHIKRGAWWNPSIFRSKRAHSATNSPYNAFRLSSMSKHNQINSESTQPYLLPLPIKETIGNFFDSNPNKTSFIQCHVLGECVINGKQYAAGYPVDIPVSIAYFENNELKFVKPDFSNYEHLLMQATTYLETNDVYLYNTPAVLTIQGDFEDKDLREFYPRERGVTDEYEVNEEISNDIDEPELSVKDLLAIEDNVDAELAAINNDEDDRQETINEDFESDSDNDDYGSFLNDLPNGEKLDDSPNYIVIKSNSNGLVDILPEEMISEEDTVNLYKDFKAADRIMSRALDVALVGSFNYMKKTYHVVKMVDPIILIGKKIDHIRGHYFSLLDDNEIQTVRPIMDDLLVKGFTSQHNDTYLNRSKRSETRNSKNFIDNKRKGGNNIGLKKSKRRWTSLLENK